MPVERTELPFPSEVGSEVELQESSPEKVTLTAFVHDPDGAPLAEVPVQLWLAQAGREPFPWRTARSDKNGIARMELPRKTANQGSWPLFLGFGFPNAEGAAVSLDLTALPEDPVPLELAGLGSVEIHLLGTDGEPWPHPTTLTFRTAPKPRLLWGRKEGLPELGPEVLEFQTDGDGRATLPCLADGRRYEVAVFTSGFGTWERRTFAAPKTGETLKVEVRLLEAKPLYAFRLLDAQGQPVVLRPWIGAMKHVSLTHQGQRSGSSRVSGITDKHGMARFPYRGTGTDLPPTRVDLEVECAPGEGAEVGRGALELTGKLKASGGDLGTLRLAREALLAAGRIRDEEGAVPEGLSVEVVALEEGTSPGLGRDIGWPLTVKTEWLEEGGFRIHGASPAARFRLKFQAPGFHANEIRVPAGRTGLHVVLERSLVIRGRVEGLAESHLGKARLVWVPDGAWATANSRSGETQVIGLEADGSFLFTGLRSSTRGGLHLYLGLHDPPLARLDFVRPHPIEDDPHALLTPWKVEPYWHYLMRFEDARGHPVEGVRYRLRLVDAVFHPPAGYAHGDHIEFFSTSPIPEVGIYHPFHRFHDAELKPGENVLQLEEAIQARLEILEPPVVPEGMELHASLLMGPGSRLLNGHTWKIPSGLPGVLPSVPLPGVGTYRIELQLKKDRHSQTVEYPDGGTVFVFDVWDEPGQVIQFAFPNEGIAKAARILDLME